MSRISARAAAAALLLAIGNISPLPAMADDTQEGRQLVEKAHLTLDAFLADSQMGPPLRNLLPKARGVLIFPQVLRGAFIVGVSGGTGVLLVRDLRSGEWGGPAFYTIGQASFGLQAGGEASEVVLVALTDRGVSALLATSAKLGANVGIALGPVGAGQAPRRKTSARILSATRVARACMPALRLTGQSWRCGKP